MQPLDQGIINSFKVKYRKTIVQEKLEAIEYGYGLPKLEVLDAIYKVGKAWRNVTAATIRNCFNKAGFHKFESDESDEPTAIEVDDEFTAIEAKCKELRAKYQNFNLDIFAYIDIDSNLKSRGEMTEEEIVAQTKSIIDEEKEEESDEEQDDSKTIITNRDACEHIEALRLYLTQQQSDTSAVMRKLNDLSDFVDERKSQTAKQTSISSFFSKKCSFNPFLLFFIQ